jgi:predicted site-specific integrase-resolvase
LEQLFSSDPLPGAVGRTALAYARVSSSDQLSDLDTQKKKLASFCGKKFTRFELISDLGSGLNYKKPGLNRLVLRIFRREVSHLVLNQ